MISKSHFLASMILLSTLLIACGGASALVTPKPAVQIDTHLTALAAQGDFSGSALVALDGQVLLSKGYGLANEQNDLPCTPTTRYRVHWLTMGFTAAAVLMLQEEGFLDVNDPICDDIPECPDYWQGITIHHLLTHTSAVSDWITPWEGVAPATSLEKIEQIKDKAPYFEPGLDFRYSDNGYLLLGYLIEAHSGKSYADFLQDRILTPLGMTDSGLYTDTATLAVGHRPDGSPTPPPDLTFRFSAAGLYSTVEDLYKWDQALYGDTLLSAESRQMLFGGYATTPSADFKDSQYGYGWFSGQTLNRPVILHGGLMAGYTAMLLRFPAERLTVIVLRNRELTLYDRLEIELAEIVLGEAR